MRARRLAMIGLALHALFAGWLAVFTLGLPSQASLPWWALACVGSLAGLGWLALRPEAGGRAIALALGAHAALRLYFVARGDATTIPGLLELGLAVALVAAVYASARSADWLAVALMACGIVVAAFLVRSAARGQGEAALRQAVHLGGFVALWLAARASPEGKLENA